MGIDRLMKLLNAKAPSALQSRRWDSFKGQALIIDISVMIHSYTSTEYNKAIARTDNLYRTPPNIDNLKEDVTKVILEFVERRFLKEGIIPKIVFDGRAALHKEGELEKREAEREEAKRKLGEVLETMKELDPWDRLDQFGELTSAYRRQRRYPRGIKQTLKEGLDRLNVTWYQATGEADELCASLVREGVGVAVYSTDTDQLAYLTPLLVTSVGGSKKRGHSREVEESCTTIVLSEVLKELQLTEPQFVDLCILLGTDYNTVLTTTTKKGDKSLAINYNKIYQMLLDHHSIEGIGSEHDITPLNHLACRQQFAYKVSQELIAPHQ